MNRVHLPLVVHVSFVIEIEDLVKIYIVVGYIFAPLFLTNSFLREEKFRRNPFQLICLYLSLHHFQNHI